jgi:hypothetical protein
MSGPTTPQPPDPAKMRALADTLVTLEENHGYPGGLSMIYNDLRKWADWMELQNDERK